MKMIIESPPRRVDLGWAKKSHHNQEYRQLLGVFDCITSTTTPNNIMVKFAILARLEAKPGKEQEVADFIKSALPLAEEETGTISWYALQIGPSTFGIFDTFEDEEGRNAHLSGKIAAALMAKAPELLAKDPVLEIVDLLAVK